MAVFRLFGGTVRAALVHAATEYDRQEEKKRGHNIYALAQYLRRIDEIEQDIAEGSTVRAALLAGFSGRLLDRMLIAVGEAKFTREEMFGQGLTYSR